MKYEFLGIITARGGSKGIPRKNIKLLAGKPLIEYTFEAVKNSKLISRCLVSSDDEEIINFSKSKQMEVPFSRPKELATDEAKSVDVLIHAVEYLMKSENYKPDYIITLQPTSPLRTAEDIDIAIESIIKDKDADSLVSVIDVPHIFNPNSVMLYTGKYLEDYIKTERIMQRQTKSIFYARNGAAIYISSYNLLMNERKIIGDRCLPYFMPKNRSIDIDDYYDWEIAELLMKKNQSS
ncbi:MAG: cytidylyltransferase domain-containing protein [Promethearchaeota archaeon]